MLDKQIRSSCFRGLCLLLLGLCLQSCLSADKQTLTEQNLLGTWMGAALRLDQGVYQPFPKLMQFGVDGKYRESWIDLKKADSLYQWKLLTDSIQVDTNRFPRNQIQLQSDELIWGRYYPTHFYRLSQSAQLSSYEAKDSLQLIRPGIWASNFDTLEFLDGQQFRLYKDKGKSYDRHCYSVKYFEDFWFLQKKGYPGNCERFPHFLEQIISADDKQLVVKRWQGDRLREIQYRKLEEGPTAQASDFQLCNPYLYMDYPRHRYYAGSKTFYQGGLYSINKVFDAKYVAPPDATDSGRIRLRFIVNCQGESGAFSLLCTNYDYEVIDMDERITSQILDIGRSLPNWVPSQSNGKPIDTYIILYFKLNNGQITEIFL